MGRNQDMDPYYNNYGKRLTKSPKIYFTEPGVVSCLLDIETPSQLGRDPLLGHIFENMVVVEALKARFNAGKRSNLYFFRDTRGFEVDLILDEQRRPRPVEIKSGMTFTPAMGSGDCGSPNGCDINDSYIWTGSCNIFKL